jgi:hypothetical protein
MVVRRTGSHRSVERPRIVRNAVIAIVGWGNVVHNHSHFRNAATTSTNVTFKIKDKVFIILTVRTLHKYKNYRCPFGWNQTSGPLRCF